MYFGLFVFRLQVQVCQGVIVLSCIVKRPTLPSELAIILDGTSSNPLEPHTDGRSSNLRLKDLPRARLEPATQWVTSGLPTTVLFPPMFTFAASFVCHVLYSAALVTIKHNYWLTIFAINIVCIGIEYTFKG